MRQVRDYTSEFKLMSESPQATSMAVRFILYNSGNHKLALLKAIKDVTQIGLKDAKSFLDETLISPVMFKKYMTYEEMDLFRNRLSQCDGAVYEFDDREKIRNKKLLDLGICDKSDLSEELSEMSTDAAFMGGFDTTKLKKIFNKIYSELSEEKLREIYDNKDYFI